MQEDSDLQPLIDRLRDDAITPTEHLLRQNSTGHDSLAVAVADICQQQRSGALTGTSHEQCLKYMANAYIAPLLCGFVYWVMQQAQKDGVKRLFFLSRDAYVMKEIASVLFSRADCTVTVECRYLYASRLAWELASIQNIEDAVFSILQPHQSCSFLKMSLRAQCSPQELRAAIHDTHIKEIADDCIFSQDEVARIEEEFRENTELQELLKRQAESARDTLCKYLEQESAVGNDWAFVDVGWHGTLQNCYEKLMAQKPENQSKGYYIGSTCKDPAMRALKKSWLFSFYEGRRPEQHLELMSLVESFCSAPHGSLSSYVASADGKVHPEFRPAIISQLDAFGMPLVRETVMDFAEALAARLDTTENLTCDEATFLDLIVYLQLKPGLLESKVWGRIPYEGAPTLGSYNTLASPIRADFSDMLYCFKRGKIPNEDFTKWTLACLKLTPTPMRWFIYLLITPARMASRLKLS